MALTAQLVINDTSADLRYDLDGTAGSGTDYTLMLPWVDRIHKDVLHQSVFAHHARKVTSITSVAATRSYSISATDVRRIEMVYDTVNQRILLPFDQIAFPNPTEDPKSLPGAVGMEAHDLWHRTQSIFPAFYRVVTATSSGTNAHTLYLFPPPASASQAGNIDIHYMKEVASLAAGTDNLEVPADARQVMAAGVNWLAFGHQKRTTESQAWFTIYEALKRGERVIK